MSASAAPLSRHHHSLVAWLVLNGVTHEVSVNSSAWQKAAPPPRNDDTPAETKPAARPALRAVESPASVPVFENLAALNAFVRTSKDLGLCKTATQAVLGSGQTTAPELMIIADMPDTAEDASGQAFMGPSHLLIRKALAAAGFDLEACYFTYLSKWRTPGQRNLSEYEAAWMIPMLQSELRFVQPRAILLLGDTVGRAIFGLSTQKDKILTKNTNVEIQALGKSLPILSSQKSEILVKNISMKKSFWFSLMDFAATLRAQKS